MEINERIAKELLGLARELVAQRRKDKDRPHLPKGDDKSKLRDDRKKPKGLDKSDPDSKDTKKDPDMRTARVAVARRLVGMARAFVALSQAKKTYEINGDRLRIDIVWNDDKNHFCDYLAGYELAGKEVNKVESALKELGIVRGKDDSTKPIGHRDRAFGITCMEGGDDVDSMVMQFVIDGQEPSEYEPVLRRLGYQKK